MQRRVMVDEEVYAFLAAHANTADETDNDILRRLLVDDVTASQTAPAGHDRFGRGDLWPFLAAGLVAAGDDLVFEQPSKQIVHRGTVTASGCVEVRGMQFRKLSPALRVTVGHEISGWRYWTHVRSRRRLQDLRVELRARPTRQEPDPAIRSGTAFPGSRPDMDGHRARTAA